MNPSDGTVLITAAGWHDEAPGGANRLPSDFARFLAERGYAVAYVCPSGEVGRTVSARIDGVDLWRYPAPAAPSPSLRNVRHHWMSARAIVGRVRGARRIVALLGHSALQYLAASGVCASGVRRCYGVHSPLAAELHEGAPARPSVKQRLAWRAAGVAERRIFTVSDVVHCDSAYTQRYIESAYPRALNGKAVVLPGWVDTARFRISANRRDELRVRLGAAWCPGVPTFFTLRRLVPRMGLDRLVEAVAALARGGLAFHLLIGGEGPERPALERLATEREVADRVRFLGRIPEGQLPDSFAAADCFVLPTRALECFGLIVLEAYACGVPVIGVPVGAIPEIVGPEFAGWIADDNHAAALARRMSDFLAGRLAADPGRLRRRALEFDIRTIACEHERVLLGCDGPSS